MAKPEKRKRALELRSQGWRIKDIAEEINIRADTVSKWCRSIELTPEQIKKIAQDNPAWLGKHEAAQKTKEDALNQRLYNQEIGRLKAQSGSALHLKGCMLYWAEGAKNRNHLQFVNTDKHMLKLFLHFLREEFSFSDDNLYIQIMHHTKDRIEIEQIEAFWRDWLNLSADCKVNMQLKKGSTSRKTSYQYGICSIGLNDTGIVQQIFGSIQEYLDISKPDWVE